MSDQDEKLSYLLDGYDAENADSLIDEVVGDVNLQYQIRRYRMIGEVMRHELPGAIDTEFHHGVMAKIRSDLPASQTDQVEQLNSPRPSSILNWLTLKPFAGLAVAAIVAVVTVTLWKPGNPPGQVDDLLVSSDQQKVDQLVSQKIQGTAVAVSTQLQPIGMRWKVKKNAPDLQQKLNAYLVNHTEYSNSMQGLIPQARVAGFDAQQ